MPIQAAEKRTDFIEPPCSRVDTGGLGKGYPRKRVSGHVSPGRYPISVFVFRQVSVESAIEDPRDIALLSGGCMKIVRITLVLALWIGGAALAQRPKQNVSGARHPNLAAAQRFSEQAWQKIVAAQEANEFDMQGHAQKAKNLLDEANKELKAAAEAANRNK
jgi:hypothetical protein